MRLALFITLPILIAVAGCGPSGPAAPKDDGHDGHDHAASTSAPTGGPVGKLEITDSAPGTGSRKAAMGDTVWVMYAGRLTNGTEFDTNKKVDGKPYKVTLGAGEVIKGWEEGLVGSKPGMKRRLKIPYDKAYGETGRAPTIPPKADLIFDLDVLALVKQEEEGLVDATDIKKGTGPLVKDGSTITVNYVGKLVNGNEFDSTKAQGKPYTFKVGAGEILKGIDAGVVGMKQGGKRRLFIPPKLGIPFGSAKVPPQSPLIMEVEVLTVK